MAKYRWWKHKNLTRLAFGSAITANALNADITTGLTLTEVNDATNYYSPITIDANGGLDNINGCNITGELNLNGTSVQESMDELSTRVQVIETLQNCAIEPQQYFYENGCHDNVYCGMNREDLTTAVLQSIANANSVNYSNDPNNVITNIVRNVIREMRTNGEI